MDLKRPITTLCIFSVVLLFTQCEKEEIVVKKAEQFATDISQDANAKKPDNPDGGQSSVEDVTITGDVSGEGLVSTSAKEFEEGFTLTLGERFNEDAGSFTGEIRILYGTKRKSENRIDFYYVDQNDVPKYLLIRAETNSGVYDETDRILNLENCYAVIFVRYTNGEIFTEYIPTSAIVFFEN